ncbi:hypothetical protein B296_00036307 [Ensete ventricosum]|uniref:Uncharacterized protein n=1 Tax=Ensete ventricosum TaxID=4639 RepID=A0A427A312_ENSVE|nr:hypothetical protein B296_00036307 [Ensete ventricosum]
MEVREGLGLSDVRNRVWHIQGTCALKGDGLYEGLDWLASTLTSSRSSDTNTSEKVRPNAAAQNLPKKKRRDGFPQPAQERAPSPLQKEPHPRQHDQCRHGRRPPVSSRCMISSHPPLPLLPFPLSFSSFIISRLCCLELDQVGGMESIEEALQNQSPKNVQASSTYHPRSSRRISTRRAAAATASADPKEQPASPLPRARRVTAMDFETGRLFSEEEDNDEEQKEAMMEITPMAKPSTKKQPRGTTTARNTRRRATKKEDGEAADEGFIEAAKTPATRNGRRTTARKEAESAAVVDEGTEETVVSSITTTRRTRQSSKSIPVDVTATTVRRSSRARAKVSVQDMESLAQDVEEQAEKGEDDG